LAGSGAQQRGLVAAPGTRRSGFLFRELLVEFKERYNKLNENMNSILMGRHEGELSEDVVVANLKNEGKDRQPSRSSHAAETGVFICKR